MKLNSIKITGYRSVKEDLPVHIDNRITTLIGANDTGKTNLLTAIQCLNDDVQFPSSERNWDVTEDVVPTIEWTFSLTLSERGQFASTLETALAQRGETTTIRDIAEDLQFEMVKSHTEPSDSAGTTEIKSSVVLSFPNEIKFRRKAGGAVEVVLPTHELNGFPELQMLALQLRPRAELFTPAEQRMDEITLSELQSPEQEFMQGIFRYAGIWDDRTQLFQQTPVTELKLERASSTFTEKIKKEWQQGEELSFRLRHAGQNGDRIHLYIRDPAVGERFVKPSERSAGFSAFFKTSMRLRARTDATKASSYIWLFDEPGTALHPAGQVNLLRVFERLSDDNQIVYATHSLFMINHNRPERNRVISKGQDGTKIDQKPFLKNWQAVRKSLGLILAGTFFIADRTLLVEGESDAMYIGAMLAAFDRAGSMDVDLNLFSVQWAGNARDFTPMARLLLEEGRDVVVVVDGDDGGKQLKRGIERLNAEINANQSSLKPIQVIELSANQSIENILPERETYYEAVVKSRAELIERGFREAGQGEPQDDASVLAHLQAYKPTNCTLGRYTEETSKSWFKEPDPISKLMIARNYVARLESTGLQVLTEKNAPKALKEIVQSLRLGSKQSDRAVFEKPQ